MVVELAPRKTGNKELEAKLEKTITVDTENNHGEMILVFKALRPMDEGEHIQLSDKVRYENEKSGVKAVLMPFSCEVDDSGTV